MIDDVVLRPRVRLRFPTFVKIVAKKIILQFETLNVKKALVCVDTHAHICDSIHNIFQFRRLKSLHITIHSNTK